jgi:hypothetical protein
MEKRFLIFLVLFSTIFCFGQNKLEYKNIDIGFGGFSVKLKNSNNESGGMTFYLNNEFKINKNLLSVDLLIGGGAGSGYLSVGGDYNFYRLNFLYGREFEIVNWLVVEPNLGLGYYHQNSEIYFTNEKMKKSIINFPIKVSLITLPYKKVGIGVCANYDMNQLNNTFSGNIFLRINLNK